MSKIELQNNILSEEDKQKEIQKVKDLITAQYLRTNVDKLKITFSTKKLNLVMSEGPMFGENKIALDEGSGLQKRFLNMSYVKKAPGPPAQEIIDQENESLRRDRQNLTEAKKQLKQAETLITEKRKKKKKRCKRLERK